MNEEADIQRIWGASSVVVQWWRLHPSSSESMGLIPGPGAKLLPAALCSQKKKFLINLPKVRINDKQDSTQIS